MCGAFLPDLTKVIEGLPSDLAAAKTQAAQRITERKAAVDAAMASIGALAAPQIQRGADLKPVVVSVFTEQSKTLGESPAAINSATSLDELRTKLGTTAGALEDSAQRLSEFDEVLGSPALEQELLKIASCKALFSR